MWFWKWLLLLQALLLDGDGETDDATDEGDGDTDTGEDADSGLLDPQGRLKGDMPKNPKAFINTLGKILARQKRKVKTLEQQLAEVRSGSTDEEVRLENLFLRSIMKRGDIADLETAFALLGVQGFKDLVNLDDPDSMDEALDRLMERYPFLIDYDSDSSESDNGGSPKKGQRKVTKKKEPVQTDATLGQRFPALRGRVPRR